MKTISILQIATAAGFILFWLGFFTIGFAPEGVTECYYAYEHAFPLPDLVLAAILLASGVLTIKGKLLGGTLGLVAAGALVFLGLLDFSFNIQNGIYTSSVMDLALNAFINIWCVAFGMAVIWRYRHIDSR